MKMLKYFLLGALLLIIAGCASPQNTVEMVKIDCPDDGIPRAWVFSEKAKLKGGGITKFGGICGGYNYVKDENGKILQIPGELKIATAGNYPDRGDTIIPSLLGAGSNVWSAYIKKDGMVEAAAKSGPGLVLINQNDNKATGGYSSAAAISQQTSDVTVDVSSKSNLGPHYYDPTK